MDSFIEKSVNDIYKTIGIFQSVDSNPVDAKPTTQYYPFKLPIKYLDETALYPLSPVVSNDLELLNTTADHNMYDCLFQPTHEFGKNMIREWNTNYCTNIPFLNDTQLILGDFSKYKLQMSKNAYSVDCSNLQQIWKDTKEDAHFLEKYSYMDWSMLEHLNHSSSFLQILSVANITSPLMSLMIPIVFLIFPFIILKLQKIPISFTVYIDTLKNIAKNHFIGKTLMNLQSMSWDKVIYVFMTFGLYIMQIYQNVNACYRFYNNMNKVNNQLCELRDYLDYSIQSMATFIQLNSNKATYALFINNTMTHLNVLKQLHTELHCIKPFKPQFSKIYEYGYMLKCYYELHSNMEYADSIQYSFGFEGYINNLMGVYSNIENKKVAYASFDLENDTAFKSQYYPPLKDGEYVVNDCSFNKNMIISGPNASGKTTVLKTTTINIIFSQQVGCGFYSACSLNPYTHIHSYLNIPDTSGRDSLFQAESRRCKDIIEIINANSGAQYRHFCIFDELYSGTNPEEASKAGYAFLKYLANYSNVNFILTTHYFAICKKFRKSAHIQNYKMEVNILNNGKFEYTYKIKKGISKIKGAIRVLKDMDYPAEIIQTIENNT